MMKKGQIINQSAKDIRYIVNADNYDISNDKRLLIPFIEGQKVGFINQHREVVTEAKYDIYLGDVFSPDDLITVMINTPYYEVYNNGTINPQIRKQFGVINSEGIEIVPVEYDELAVSDNQKLITLRKDDKGHSVINRKGEVIVPFGSYDHIDGFTNGYARIKIGKVSNGIINNGNKWGIINEEGEVVLPLVYDDIWKFYKMPHLNSTTLVNNGHSFGRFWFGSETITRSSIPKVNVKGCENVELG